MKIELTAENAARIAEYSELIGWTDDELANHILAETHGLLAEPRSGSLEEFLRSIEYRDRACAERALARVIETLRTRNKTKLPDSFHGEILELPNGHFDITAEWTGRHDEIFGNLLSPLRGSSSSNQKSYAPVRTPIQGILRCTPV
jgi:hypothetical protein